MLAVLDMIERENQMYIDIGRKEGKIEGFKEIAKKLLNKNKYYNEGDEINIEKFTYKEYIKYKPIFEKLWKIIDENNSKNYSDELQEAKEEYKITSSKTKGQENKINQMHDKIFRTILDKKENAVFIINKAVDAKIKIDDIEKYKNSFVNKMFQNREADIVYKMKDKNIFFLIEHQTKIDYSMPFRILEYEVAIMKSAIDENKINTPNYKLPLVIPIVLYTGNKKWNAAEYLQKSQETLRNIKEDVGRYNLIDINDLEEKELLEDDTFITKMMLIEKSKSKEEIIEKIEKVIERTKENDESILTSIIKLVLKEKIGDQEVTRLINKIEGGNKEMLAVLDMIERENQMYIDIGRKEGIKEKSIEIAKKLLSKKTSKKEISEITGLDESEIDKIARK